MNFAQAVRQGLGKDQGLFFPETIPALTNIDELLALPLVERSQKILSALIGEELPKATLDAMVKNAFTFPAPLEKVEDNIYALELFHGPTLAFKDQCCDFISERQNQSITRKAILYFRWEYSHCCD